jgi:precorrin-2 dehydrogenase/sirohydrochlorin ferrochelatase
MAPFPVLLNLNGVSCIVVGAGRVAERKIAALRRAKARRRRILVDVVDAPELGTFSMPAVLSRGPLQIAVATSGESPALARVLKRDLARRFGPEYGPHVRLVGEIRRRLVVEVAGRPERERRSQRLLRAPLLPLIRSGRIDRARRAARLAAGLH